MHMPTMNKCLKINESQHHVALVAPPVLSVILTASDQLLCDIIEGESIWLRWVLVTHCYASSVYNDEK